jgi:7-carboxy-7-deazaguanine synthase
MKGKVAELFESIQGEGLYFGEKQFFVRFFGCNLSCKFCDTKLNYFKEYEPGELFSIIKQSRDGFRSVSFTGGEPLLQKDFLKEILKLTKAENLHNYLETNGTLPEALEEVIDYIDIIAMDLKLPSSTGMGNFWEKHARFLNIASRKEVFLKTVISMGTKDSDLKEMIKLLKSTNPALTLVLQPDYFQSDIALTKRIEKFRDMITQENIATCIIPQMHKIIGAP